MAAEANEPIATLRALRYYSHEDGVSEARPRDDVLLRFVTQRTSVTPVDPLPGDAVEHSIGYGADPIVFAELRNGAVAREGCFVFTERNELLRESVDRLSSVAALRSSNPELEDALAAAEVEPVPGAVAVLGGQRDENYFHWWIDVIARCWLIHNSPYRGCRIVTGRLTEDFQHESLRLLGQSVLPLTRPFQRFGRVVSTRGLTHGSSQSIVPQVTEFSQWCRRTLKLTPSAQRRRLFLSRRAARTRCLVNEEEVLAALGDELEVVELEAKSVEEQAALFCEADVVVAPHGAALTNLLFCPQATAVIELVDEQAPPHTYRRLASLLGHPYIAVGCKPECQRRHEPGRRDIRARAMDVVTAVESLRPRKRVAALRAGR